MNTEFNFLAGGGEMGKLIREKDWSTTPLGNPVDWPQSLKTMVTVMLENPFAMYIIWGSEYTQMYNSAYRPILGSVKHPQALGISSQVTFSEVWDTIGPMFDDVFQGKPVSFHDMMFVLNRHGYDEVCYFDFAYSPIRLDNGEIGGVLVTVIETTAKKNTEKELRELNNQLEFAIEATELGTFDYNPLTYKFSANDRLTEWFGLSKRSEIELSHALESVVERDRDRVEEAIAEAMDINSGGRYKIDYTIINVKTSQERVVRASGRVWFNNDKIAVRFNGTLQDISAQFDAEKEKQKLIAIIEASDEYIGLTGMDSSVQYINPAGLKMLGWDNYECKYIMDGIYPPDRDLALEILPKFIDKESYSHEIRFWNEKTGEPFWVQWNGVTIRDASKNEAIGLATVSPNITDRKLAEEKLKISENKLKMMIHQAPVAITVLRGKDHVVEITNSKTLEISGNEEHEILNKPLLDSLPEMISQGVKEVLDNVYRTGEGYTMTEFPLELMKNEKRETMYLNFRFEPLFDEEGKNSGIMSVGYDVTEQVLSRKKIEINEQKLNVIINASELGIWEYNIKKTDAIISERCMEILGLEGRTDLPHAQMLSNFHPDDLKIRKAAFELSYQTGFLNYIARVIWPDGTTHWVEAKGKVFYDAANQPRELLGTLQDVTKEKLFKEKLLEREQKFRLLADSMPQFVWTSDPEGNLNYFNQSVYDFTGLSKEEIEKKGWIDIVHDEDREENIEKWVKSIATGKDFIFEHRFRMSDGSYRWQLSRAIPQRNENGTIQMWVGTSTDIQDQKMFVNKLETQVQKRTNELEKKNVELEKMNKELQSFAYISSHDLQEPLRKIQIFSSRIIELENENLSESGKYYFSRMQKSANRMQILIKDLLAYSRTTGTEQKKEKITLEVIVNEIRGELMEELDSQNAEIIVSNSCEIKVISFQFRQLLNNLISNSLKFAKETEIPIITISSEIGLSGDFENMDLISDKKYCHIRYTDNGIGFEQQYSSKIFELFQRLTPKEASGGTGIGLAIVKKIVDNHFGVITATSVLNEGATFDIYIPS